MKSITIMEFNTQIIVLLSGILLTGLTAGLCFTWSNAVTSGIGRLDNLTFLKSFQSMNRVIINGKFLIVFFGPVILLFLNTYLFKSNTTTLWLFLVAAILFFVGVGLVTVFGNVPLNEILDKSNLETLTSTDLQELRNKFEQPWNRWHMVRTFSSLISFSLLLIGLAYIRG
ncbi:MAG: DUF1772 domain-containing protein [Balneola sp.]